ncbi:MAG TPA: VOC family protein [Vicinamibacterales bacterium]|jgi:lactoylglutathione lyase|nr:VOC family protein [Vicinamibacterales bacterium]
MKNYLGLAALTSVLVALPGMAGAADYHHVHLAAPNVAEAVQWYMTNMGCTAMNRPDACQIGTTQLIFANRKPDAGSQGSGVDHIGFSFPDLAAKMRAFEAAGVKIVTPMRDAPGLFKLGFIEDPWGTRIEVVEDPEYLGFHHIHLRSADPDAALKWYQNVFGGETDSLKKRINGLRYGKVWLLIARVDEGQKLAATQGRSIDHLGFAFADLDAAAAEIKKKGVAFQTEPRPFTNAAGQNMKISFVVGPDDVRIEVVQPKA